MVFYVSTCLFDLYLHIFKKKKVKNNYLVPQCKIQRHANLIENIFIQKFFPRYRIEFCSKKKGKS